MSHKRSYLFIALLFLLISLACSGVGSAPAEPSPAIPVATSTPSPGGGPAPPPPGDLEIATVAEVIDGDTIELANGRRVRYIGINTPERDQPYYEEATAANHHLVGGREVQLERDVESIDQYGRILAYVWVDGILANLEIVRQGFANAFTVPPNVRYEEQFLAAEREARAAGRGLWAGSDVALKIIHIEADAPGNDNDNPNGEWVEIANQGAESVQMQGYTLKDEANHIYTFGDFILEPEKALRLFSGQGQNNETELYWGSVGESIWNNGGDTAFLRDVQGALIDSYAY
jgi:micrococcal nuclease